MHQFQVSGDSTHSFDRLDHEVKRSWASDNPRLEKAPQNSVVFPSAALLTKIVYKNSLMVSMVSRMLGFIWLLLHFKFPYTSYRFYSFHPLDMNWPLWLLCFQQCRLLLGVWFLLTQILWRNIRQRSTGEETQSFGKSISQYFEFIQKCILQWNHI